MTGALTVISETRDMRVYFSMSEPDFLAFKQKYAGNTVADKVKQMPPVQLVLADNSLYPQAGKVELVDGQFDKTVGAIKFRASFPNAEGMLRSGSTGKVRIPTTFKAALVIRRMRLSSCRVKYLFIRWPTAIRSSPSRWVFPGGLRTIILFRMA